MGKKTTPTKPTRQAPHPAFPNAAEPVTAEALALRFRVTEEQAKSFLVTACLEKASWQVLHDCLGFGLEFPICHRTDEVAKMLGVSTRVVHGWVKSRKLAVVPFLVPIRILASETMAFLASRSTTTGEVSDRKATP